MTSLEKRLMEALKFHAAKHSYYANIAKGRDGGLSLEYALKYADSIMSQFQPTKRKKR